MPADLDVTVGSGRLRAWAFGPDAGPLVVGIPGLTANSREFAAVGERLAAAGRRFVALDLRGRGYSDITGAGSYGWGAHATDVVEAAAQLGADEFDVVGHSMGGFVSLQLAADHPQALRRLVLVDALGLPDEDALIPIAASVQRLGRPSASADEHIAAVRAGGFVEPWSQLWEDYYRYELADGPDGTVVSRTDATAIVEDLEYARSRQASDLWSAVGCPVLVLRATTPLGPEGGTIVRRADVEAFCELHPGAQVVEVPANHYGVIADRQSLDAIAAFLT
jgi:pimeloyl-ACP methyl ester carboxylesterase